MIYIIDRFEGDFAVCEGEDKIMISILKIKLPCNCKEGSKIEMVQPDVFRLIDNSGDREAIKKKMSNLFK